MPLTEKGQKIMANMKKEYGSKEGESAFYASKNAGKISGVDAADVTQPNTPMPPTSTVPGPAKPIAPMAAASGYAGTQAAPGASPSAAAGGFSLPATYTQQEILANSFKYGGAGKR